MPIQQLISDMDPWNALFFYLYSCVRPYMVNSLCSVLHAFSAGTTWLPQVREVKEDAVSVARLRSCGMIVVGKAVMHELGMGTTGNNPHHGYLFFFHFLLSHLLCWLLTTIHIVIFVPFSHHLYV